MKARRSAAAAIAGAAIAAMSIQGALGGGAAGAATVKPATVKSATATIAAATGVRWHRLHLLGGWVSENSQVANGNPAWAIRAGIVYLRGSMHQPSGSSGVFAVLPKAARPAHQQYITVPAGNETTGYVDVSPNGNLGVGSAGGDPRAFTSLAGISFPVAATARHKLTLRDGWQSAQEAVWHSGDASYTVAGGVVHLTGALSQPTSGGFVFAVLPESARPAHLEYFVVYTFGATTGTVQIYPNGKMYAFGAQAHLLTSLAAITYPVKAVKSRALKAINGWTSGIVGAGPPSYTVIGGAVYLSGTVHRLSGNNVRFALLPRGARPAHDQLMKAYTLNGLQGIVYVFSSGQLWAYGSINSDSLTSLAGISYPLSS